MDKPYVGFWWRLLAYIIDAIIIMALFFVIGMVSGLSMMGTDVDPATGMPAFSAVVLVLQIAIPIIYYAVMQASSMQATVGKMAIGAIVTDINGDRMGYGKAFIREICKWPSAMVLLIGFIMVAFTARKQGLHDIMAGTLVLKKKMVNQMVSAGA